MGTQGESGEHETDSLVMGSESDGDVHCHNERRNDGTEKMNDGDSMRNAGRESLSDATDDDRSRHAADHSESKKDNSHGKGNEICRMLCDEKNDYLNKTF